MTIKEQIIEWTSYNLDNSFRFRENQLEAIENIVSNIVNKDDSNQVVEAPTGSGKSIIILVSAGVLSDYYNKKSYILCSDLSLWNQYYTFIKRNRLPFGYLKGQTGNYMCLLNGNSVRCGECRIAGKGWNYLINAKSGFKCASKCKYIHDRRNACASPVTLMTYQCYLYTLMHQEEVEIGSKSKSITPREVIFCDECHHLADVVMSQFSPKITHTDIELADNVYSFIEKENEVNINVSSAKFKKELLKLYKKLQAEELDNDENLSLVNQFYDLYSLLWNAVKDQEEWYKENYKDLDLKERRKVAEMYRLFESVIIYGDTFRDLISSLISSDYLIKEVNGENINFYNLKQDYLVYKALLNKSNHRVMLSATIGNIDVFADNIGIKYLDNKELSFERIPSIFNFDKSPILIYPKYKINWKNKNEVFPEIKRYIYDICSKHAQEKGIIQTTSYSDAVNIYESAPKELQKRLLIYNNSTEKEVILKEHLRKPDSILLGPTLNEGLDLPDDLCRFIIISKIPYPQLNSKFIKKKIELFKGWYQSETSLKLIQGIGRGIRNENDYCTTYILDACFFDLYKSTKDQYPEYLQKRLYVESL